MSLLVLVVDALDLLIQILFFLLKAIELPLSFDSSLYVLLEIAISELPHFFEECFDHVGQLGLVMLNFTLVALNIGVLLQDAAKLASGVLELLGHGLNEVRNSDPAVGGTYKDLSAHFLELSFVGEAFELRALRDQGSVALFQRPLLVHDLRNFLTHDFSHFLAHIRLERV